MTASESTQRVPDALTAGLMPVVIHRLNNATQLLANFQALMQLGGADDLLRDRAGDLAETAETVHELGYVLAVIAAASGADLLRDRREARGLAWTLDAVRDGLRREGREVDAPAGPLPDLAPGTGDGWRVAWAFGSAVYAAGLAAPVDAPLSWSLRVDDADGARVLRLAGATERGLADPLAAIRDRLPEVAVVVADDAVELRFPGGCFRGDAA